MSKQLSIALPAYSNQIFVLSSSLIEELESTDTQYNSTLLYIYAIVDDVRMKFGIAIISDPVFSVISILTLLGQ
jgi:hypothetical protein